MGETTDIAWTDATVNFWWGCTKVGPGCDNCYAESWSSRFGESIWGAGAPRRKIKGAVKLMYRLDNGYADWAADHACGLLQPECGLRRRVFVQSMSDLFDLEVPQEWFNEAWSTIELCDRISIQIVTKRVSAVEKRIGKAAWPRHAGLLITVTNQAEADRDIPRLRALKAKLGIPWVGLSIEPMLGAIVIPPDALRDLDWVIVGGESGPRARPMHPAWVRSLRDQCAAADVAFLFKQWGEFRPYRDDRAHCFWLDPDGHVYGGPTNWPPKEDEPRAAMVRVGKARAGNLLDGREHMVFPS